MKPKYLLFTAVLSVFSFVYSQTASKAVFYNKGLMTVKADDTTKTILYIQGDMYVGTDATDVDKTCDIKLDNAKVELTGDFINNVKTGTVFNNQNTVAPGVFLFNSDTEQRIYTDGISFNDRPSKKTSYIDFPHLKIRNASKVTVEPEIAIRAKNVYLPLGWLVLKSKRVSVNDFPGTPGSGLLQNRTISAHLLPEDNVYYTNMSDPDPEKRGMVQVDLAVDENSLQFEYRSIYAMGPPFKRLKADYFMFNFLVAPSSSGFMGDLNSTISDPAFTLDPGRGYVLGIDLRGSNPDNYNLYEMYPGISFDHRATEGYNFNRSLYAMNSNPNQWFGDDPSVPEYQLEQLNTGDIENIELRTGFNYLANPYTCPLDISDLLGSNEAADWGVISDNETNPGRDLVNRVWVMNGDAKARTTTETARRVHYSYKYYVALNEGGTYTGDYSDIDGEMIIAPMQMFVVYAPKPGIIKIPRTARTMGNTQFIRSGKPRTDDFIFEITDETTGTSDRVSVVLRDNELIGPGKKYQNVNRVKTNAGEGSENVKTTSADDIIQTLSGQIYTRDIDDTPLTVHFLPLQETISTVLYLTPSEISQPISVKGIRLNSMDEIREIWLEDKLFDKMILMQPETVYESVSNPDDRRDRFVLHFNTENTVGVDPGKVETISAYHRNKMLYVTGLDDADVGSTITVYDVRGHILKNIPVTEGTMQIDAPFSQGAYIVKVTGKRSFVKTLLIK